MRLSYKNAAEVCAHFDRTQQFSYRTPTSLSPKKALDNRGGWLKAKYKARNEEKRKGYFYHKIFHYFCVFFAWRNLSFSGGGDAIFDDQIKSCICAELCSHLSFNWGHFSRIHSSNSICFDMCDIGQGEKPIWRASWNREMPSVFIGKLTPAGYCQSGLVELSEQNNGLIRSVLLWDFWQLAPLPFNVSNCLSCRQKHPLWISKEDATRSWKWQSLSVEPWSVNDFIAGTLSLF